jgi:5-methylcytosine-specific restriction endonuclease McrA
MMQKLCQKRPRLKLSVEEYTLLRRRVLERDGWRCQNCGSAKDLQAHHLSKRSKLGDDALDNLITLCVACHQMQHHSSTFARNDSS